METPDPQRERQRLIALYAAKSDGELQELAQSAGDLDEIAVQVLAEEAQRRGLELVLAQAAVPMKAPEEQELVVIRQFRDMPEALLAKGALDSVGVECYLIDDNMIRMDWFWSNGLGGIKLAVKPSDADAALDILEQPIPDTFEVEGVGTYEQPRCPHCGSLDVRHEGPIDKRIALPALWFALPVPVPRNIWKCAACGAEWREPGDAGHPGAPQA